MLDTTLVENDLVLERALQPDIWSRIKDAQSYQDIALVFADVYGLKNVPGLATGPTAYKNENSDFGLKVRGIKTREKINAKARDILKKADSLKDLSQEDIDFLKQYSGRGGLTENSQFEYYTPTPIAEGVWDILKMHGFKNGNVLDPCTGAGVFPSTKPEGVLMTGTDIDPVGSKIAQMFNPEDSINNGSFESLVVKTDDNTFDSVVGNVPFGNARGKNIHDDPAYKTEKTIERYFLLRIMDKLKPGGLACLVVPINIVGAKNDKWKHFRIAMSKKGEFLGAHKLPSKAFGAQGTDTVVDIVVFKKHPKDLLEKIDDIDFGSLKESKVVWDEFINGQYWMGEGKRFIQGKYVPKAVGERWSRETVDGDIDPIAVKKKLAQQFNSRIDWDALKSAPVNIKNYADGDQKIINGIQYEMLDNEWQRVHQAEKESIGVDENKYGAKTIEDLKAILASPEGSLQLTAKQLFAVYKTWPDMLSTLQKDAVEFSMSQSDEKFHEQACRGTIIGGLLGRLKANPDEDERTRLQEMVVAEINKYGHPKNNGQLCLTGSSSREFGLFMNSVGEKGQFSDFLAGTLKTDKSEFDSTNVQSIVEHLFVREGIHTIELEDVKKLYAGTMKLDTLGDLAQVENIAITAEGMIMPFGRYTAGDIYVNVQAMTDAMADEEDDRITAKWQQQIDAINKKRKVTATEDISFGLQDKWYPKEYLISFLRENGYPNVKYGYYEKTEKEDPLDGSVFKSKQFVEDANAIGGEIIGIEGSGFPKQFLKYLNGGKITSSKAEYIEQYKNECNAITENFNAWMQQHEDIDQVAATYNRKFNAFLPHEYEDTDLHLEGFSKQVKLHGYQNSAIRRLSEEGRGILGDDVGLGKTFSAIALAQYNKQMGRSKKTCIVVPDAVLANWYHEVNFLTGNMNDVLFVGFEPKRDKEGNIIREAVKDEAGQKKINKLTGKAEYQDVLIKRKSKKEIWEKMWEIPTTNKPLVIMTKEKFGSIPMRPETKGRYTSKMVDRSLISDKTEESLLKEGKKSYQDDKTKANLEAKYSDEGTRKKEELPYFEDMGFSDVIIDEAHEFKNSYQPGKDTKGIAYLPTAPSSKRALDMTLKTSYLKDVNNGRGVYPLTATPVTNSVFEIYNMLSYVCPVEEFERFGVYTVDDFVRVFGKIESVDKVMVSGEVKPRDGLVGFRNLDGLRNLFHKYTILRNAEDVGLELPPSEEINDEVTLTGEQTDIYNILREEAKEAAKPGSKVSMFSVIRDMDRITTDIDLYNHKMTFHFRLEDEAKVQNLVADLPGTMTVTEKGEDGRLYKNEISVTHETFKKDGAFVLVVPEQVETAVITRLTRFGIDENDVSHPLMPKYAKLIKNLRLHLEANGKQIIFTEEKSQHQKIKRILAHHVPLAQGMIGIINAETAEGNKLQKISDSYNSGKIKIVIANKKAEVGVNLQNGTTAIHHLTLCWTPTSIQQRNGRGARQGNKAKNIKIYYYLGGKSFDYYRLDLLKRKSNWMRELFNGDATESENANALSQDDMMDLLADNPEEAKRLRMERLAKQKDEREERERRRLINMMQQVGNINETLTRFDEKREERRKKLEDDITEHERVIADLREKGSRFEKGDERRKNIGTRIIKRQGRLRESKDNLDVLDAAFDDRKVALEAKAKQLRGVLDLKAKKGELPFDARLIDHPEDIIATLDGKVIAVGDTYEDGRNGGGGICRITKVFNKPKCLQYEAVIGDIYGLKQSWLREIDGQVVLLNNWPFDKMIKCAYSEKELALKKILDTTMDYVDIAGIDKTIFYENLDKVKLSGDMLIRTDDGYVFQYSSRIEDRNTIVYPEPDKESFRKALAETCLAKERENGYLPSSAEDILSKVFGTTYKEAILKYGKTATETEIRSFYSDFVQNYLDENLENGANETDPRKMLEIFAKRYSSGLSRSIKDAARKLGDNTDQIRQITRECLRNQEEGLREKVRQIEKEEERAKLEAVKDHPDYKEIPERIQEAFRQMGITVKTNMTQAVLSGGRRFRDTTVEPFSRWFFQDEHGKGGVLFRVKDILKSRYGAKFFSSYSGDFQGAWWHVDSKEDLEDIYELMA